MLWSKTYETGIASRDEQHKELFRQADILLDRSQEDRIPQTLDFLANYVGKHFKTEEVMRQSSSYPGAEAHKKLHQGFIQEFKKLKQRSMRLRAKTSRLC